MQFLFLLLHPTFRGYRVNKASTASNQGSRQPCSAAEGLQEKRLPPLQDKQHPPTATTALGWHCEEARDKNLEQQMPPCTPSFGSIPAPAPRSRLRALLPCTLLAPGGVCLHSLHYSSPDSYSVLGISPPVITYMQLKNHL